MEGEGGKKDAVRVGRLEHWQVGSQLDQARDAGGEAGAWLVAARWASAACGDDILRRAEAARPARVSGRGRPSLEAAPYQSVGPGSRPAAKPGDRPRAREGQP